MEPFIRSDQYNHIKAQAQILVNGHSTANDRHVLDALKSLAAERATAVFEELSPEQRDLISPVSDVKDTMDADAYLAKLRPYTIPFRPLTEQSVKKLFPKAKKLKLPSFAQELELNEVSYIGWHDKGTGKYFMIAESGEKWTGLSGTFSSSYQKGICTICGKFAETGLFTVELKGSEQGTYVKKGNYICKDAKTCNENLTSVDKLHDFLDWMKTI
ncbi:FusB/FusC family EF-G-binding protein [Metabacillus indicus]|uniref:FusB/FusC family EF-G-binding protein n=1 Tax=Metabacillus indicus TaxID=246786 RepID=UPI00398403A2